MATTLKNLSDTDIQPIPDATGLKFGILVAEWNPEVTLSMAKAAKETLLTHGVSERDILFKYVPGSYELSLGAQYMAEYTDVDAVICLGCVIQGETRHFDFVCKAVTDGTNEVSLKYNIPIGFGVLTTENQQQALDRAGGKHGNKGVEAAGAAIKMVVLKHELNKENE
ncbi:MAG: 6,7-dimethyl-8-ribityllumazine synthase [Salinivirgaceae bacterium]|jgi:6,7-dimethyl-8-ribityllumazine synthase|nr:6,7-dimethyl-8-ribityllumazine synthase [Salinivirgaceae bacterium]